VGAPVPAPAPGPADARGPARPPGRRRANPRPARATGPAARNEARRPHDDHAAARFTSRTIPCTTGRAVAQDTHQEKTEAPTPRRLEKAREEGRIPVSRDAAGVASMAAALLALAAVGPILAERLAALLRTSAALAATAGAGGTLDGPRLLAGLGRGIRPVALPLFGLLAAPLAAGTFAFALQTRGNVATKSLGFRWDRVSLLGGLRRIFASKHSLFEVLLALAKATVLAVVVGAVLRRHLDTIAGLGRVPSGAGTVLALGIVARLVLFALLAMLALAVADYFIARGRVMEQIRMTKQEVKEEHKEQEGDPQVKARRRQQMRRLGRNRMIAATKDATVVVVNPTHYAVALRYDPERDGAPVLLAKGKDRLAARIRAVARKHGVPIVSDPPVARAIYAAGRLGEEVPPELYELVARVLAFLYRMKGIAVSP